MMHAIFLVSGAVIFLLTTTLDYLRSKGYFTASEEELRLNIDHTQDSPREDLPPVGSGAETSARFKFVQYSGYIIAFTLEIIGAILYFGGL